MAEQDYKITIHLRADVSVKSVRDWLPHALEQEEWKEQTIKIYGTDIEAIDSDSDKHKWIKDFKDIPGPKYEGPWGKDLGLK